VSDATKIYQIRATLLIPGAPVWRTLLVPSDDTLGQLHRVIQAAFGWEGDHLHRFELNSKNLYGGGDEYTDQAYGLEPATRDENATRLGDVLSPGARFFYEYDFGASWEHSLRIEDSLPPAEGARYPLCLSGQGMAPPEDGSGSVSRRKANAAGSQAFDPEELNKTLSNLLTAAA
jgi:hypothetical protein